MPIRIDSADYDNLNAQTPDQIKFQGMRYTIAGSADYVALSALNTAWSYSIVVSASASAKGGGISAGGLDTLRASYAKTTALTFVTDEAVTATGYLLDMRRQNQLNPTMFQYNIRLVRAV